MTSLAIWECPLCLRSIPNGAPRAQHWKNIWKNANDPTRCDYVAMATPVMATPVALTASAAVPLLAVSRISTPSSYGLSALARRSGTTVEDSRRCRAAYTIGTTPLSPGTSPRDVCILQRVWERYKGDDVLSQFCPAFWKFYLPLHQLSRTAQDATLKAAKSTFLQRRSVTYKNSRLARGCLHRKLTVYRNRFGHKYHTLAKSI